MKRYSVGLKVIVGNAFSSSFLAFPGLARKANAVEFGMNLLRVCVLWPEWKFGF